ncbi:type II toxin-antitoxin system VapC family toxin [Azospirillum sp. sgz302134]
MSIVVDASVVVKLFVQEEGSERAEASFASQQALSAPRLIAAEVASTLTKQVRRGEIDVATAEDAVLALSAALSGGMLDVCADETLLTSAARLSLTLGHALYDCLYLALAIELGGRLVTADRRFEQKLHQHGFATYTAPF